MEEFTAMKEKMIEARRKNNSFHKDMIAKIQKMCGKYSICEQESNTSSNDTHHGALGEDTDEEIFCMPPFLGRLRGRDKWITLHAYEPTYSLGAKVVSCAFLY